MAVNELIKQALLTKEGRFAYIAPTYKMAKQISWDFIKFYSRPIPNIKVNESELRIDYPSGSRITLFGADNPDNLRGLSLNGVVFDEYAQIKENVFTEIIRPALSDKEGWCIWLGTPKGKNHFYHLYLKAQDNPDWQTWTIPITQTVGAITQDEIDATKREMPQDLFQQEFMCSWLDNAGGFFKRVRDAIYTGKYEIGRSQFQIGIDLAKFQDWTVITPFNLNTFTAYPQKRFNQIDYFVQKETIKSAHHEYNKGKVVMDSTGVGEPVYDDLCRDINDIEPFHFTEQSRMQLLRNLQILFEQGKIKIPNDEGLLNELESMHYTMTPLGRTKVQVPDGMTDDRIFSLALSCFGVTEPLGEVSGTYESNAKKLTDYYKTGKVQWTPF